MTEPTNFLGLETSTSSADGTAVSILPVPFERTTSYGSGTGRGPEAVIEASAYVEFWDEELAAEPCAHGIETLPPCRPGSADLGRALAEIEACALPPLEAGRFLVSLGGEHSITAPLTRAARRVHGDLGVVQFDAHADLRDRYEGTPHSHACVMRRIHEEGIPFLGVGVRAYSAEEAALISEAKLDVIPGRELADLTPDRFAAHLEQLPEKIYLSIDVDYFDPALVPGTGTTEPGGGEWYPTLGLLRRLFQDKQVVAMDIVEVAPIPGQPASEYLAAKLAYRCIGYRLTTGI